MKRRKKSGSKSETASPPRNGHVADGASGTGAKAAACCGCATTDVTALTQDGFGPGAHAAGVDAGLKAANLRHLRRIEGQVRGIAAMIEEDRYCADIIQQCAAVQESLRSVAKNLLRNHLGHCTMAVERIASANLDEDNHDLYVLAIRDPLARLALMRGDHESAITTAMSMLEEYARDPDPEVIADFAYLSTIRARQTLVVALRSVGRERDAADAHAELVANARTAARGPSVSEILRRWLVAVEAAP